MRSTSRGGDIIGIYDAEDAPAPDQLLKVADAFRTAGPDVACLQGVLDFYNARAKLAHALLHHRLRHLVPPCAARSGAAGHDRPPWRDHACSSAAACWRTSGAGTHTTSPKTPIWASALPGAVTAPNSSQRSRRRGNRLGPRLDPPTIALDQGLCPDLGRPHARSPPASGRTWRETLSRISDPVPRHAQPVRPGPAAVVVLADAVRPAPPVTAIAPWGRDRRSWRALPLVGSRDAWPSRRLRSPHRNTAG